MEFQDEKICDVTISSSMIQYHLQFVITSIRLSIFLQIMEPCRDGAFFI